MCRSRAYVAGTWPVRTRLSPFHKATSKIQWRPFSIPKCARLGRRPRTCRRAIVDGILFGLHTDCAKHSLPHGYPDWHWVYHYFREWQQERVWERIHEA